MLSNQWPSCRVFNIRRVPLANKREGYQVPEALSDKTIDIVKSTVPALEKAARR